MEGARKIEITANGIRFVAFERGKGPLVLCLHGFPDLPTSLGHQVTALAQAGYRVVAPYMRGYAPTAPAPDGCYQLAALGRDVLGLIEALGEKRASVVSHDWGSLAAYAAAIKDPSRFERLVTVAVPYGLAFAQSFLTNYEQLKRSWYIHFFQHPMAEGVVAANDCEFVRNLWRDWSPGWQAPAEMLDQVCATLGRPEVLSAALGYYRALLDPTRHRPDLAGEESQFQIAPVKVPTLYIHGARDGCMGVELSEGMEASFPAGFHRLVVDGAGHFVLLEKPGVVNPAILDWLGRGRG